MDQEVYTMRLKKRTEEEYLFYILNLKFADINQRDKILEIEHLIGVLRLQSKNFIE